LHLDPAVTVHSLRVTALTTARERGAEIIDLQDFAGYPQPGITCVMESQTVCRVEDGSSCHFELGEKLSCITRSLLRPVQ
jgi:hypothetical protein